MFNIGDRIVCINVHDGFHKMVGLEGTIKRITSNRVLGVEWDVAQSHMHNLSGESREGRGWWIEEDCIEHTSISLENE